QAYFGQVILERFEVSQLAGEPDQFSYSLVVTEYVEPPEPATATAASVEQAIKLDADIFMEMATLPDMLALGEIPELTNPVLPLTGALDPITAAVEALQGATQALTGLFEQDGDGGTPPDRPPDWGIHPPTPLDWGSDGQGSQSPDTRSALRDRHGAPLLGPHGELLGPDGRALLGSNGELLGRDGQPILGLNGQPLGADGALRDRNGNPLLGPHGALLGPDGQPLLGPDGALLGPDGQPLRGPNGELFGAQGELLDADGEPRLGPNGALLDADGNSLLGPDGELLGPDGQPLRDEDGQPLGPDGQVIAIARLTVAVLNEVSEPVPGAPYALTLGAEEIAHGWLNMQGQVQVKGLKTETDYTLTLADFDGLEAVTVRTGWAVIALTDEASAPVAGTWYVLSLTDGSPRAGTLDATGRAVLAELEPGLPYRLSFPDYARTGWGLVEEMQPPTRRAGRVVIALTDEAGTSVAGAMYVLSLADGSTQAGTLDATGRAVLTHLVPGLTYRLSFPAYSLTAWSRVEELPRPVPQPGRVAITLVDEAGAPVPAVRYVLTLADGSTQEGWLDTTGQALLAGLVPGRAYRLSFPEVAPAAW
ncbi:MAG TPA: hypothetical protein VLQ80_32355, partial [Candidatus Saccharimonadia bacterium]|nr:hypothetical protein [Candidatus Saccharimonadia bacterium]